MSPKEVDAPGPSLSNLLGQGKYRRDHKLASSHQAKEDNWGVNNGSESQTEPESEDDSCVAYRAGAVNQEGELNTPLP